MTNRPPSYAFAQRGIVAPLVAISMVGLIAVVGLALDMGHAYLNKTRLQNTVDAAALSAAKTLDETSSTAQATAAAQSTFTQNQSASGNAEMSGIAAGSVNVTFSHKLDPFTPGSAPPMFVRVSMDSFVLPSWFIQVLGFGNKTVGASAVAGPSPTLAQVCDIVPLVACGAPTTDPTKDYLGYTLGQPVQLKASSQTNGAVGPGNFQELTINCSGAKCLGENLAGDYSSCVSLGDSVPTKPGGNVGQNFDGLNTRLGIYKGGYDPARYPPDRIISTPRTYSAYQTELANPSNWVPGGQENRRMLKVPIAFCNGLVNGRADIQVQGFGCFFMTDQVTHQGNTQAIVAEFRGQCEAEGTPGPNPVNGPGPHTIILYKDFTAGNLDS